MGGKPDVPDAPDYSALISAATKASESSYAQSQAALKLFRDTYDKNVKVSDTVVDKMLGVFDTQIDRANEEWQRYKDIFQPQEASLAKEASEFNTAERQERYAAEKAQNVAQSMDVARQAALDNLEQFGVDPSQTRAQAMDRGSRLMQGVATASAANQGRTEAENIGRALREQAINVGRGVSANSLGQLAAGAAAGNQAVNTGLATTASGAQTLGTPIDWSQMGNQSLATAGNLTNTQFGNQMDRFKADQEASSGWGDVLGFAGSLASKFLLAEGGAIPEPGGEAIPPEASPSAGAIPDDVPAQIDGGGEARLSAGEFIVPKDVMGWMGEKGMQQIILKARKEMTGGNGERPAQPSTTPPPGAIPPQSPVAIPEPAGMV
jgi:hypothetical protein